MDTPPSPDRGPGNASAGDNWFSDTVDVHGHKVLDQWHPDGIGIDDFKSLWEYGDAIEFGF